jgi:hypothetical protein
MGVKGRSHGLLQGANKDFLTGTGRNYKEAGSG